jgi:hypothetical protein
MRLKQVVPDDTMLVPGYEHHLLECPACHEIERRLVFTREIEPTPFEPRPLPPNLSKVEATESAAADATKTNIEGNAGPAAAGAIISSSWARAVDRLRSQQSSLQARQTEATASDAVSQKRRDRQDAVRRRRLSDTTATAATQSPAPAQLPKRPNNPTSGLAARPERSRPGPAPSGAMARVIAGLRQRGAWPVAGGTSTEERKRFDQMWESLAPRPQPPPALPRPQSTPPAQSTDPLRTGPPAGEKG